MLDVSRLVLAVFKAILCALTGAQAAWPNVPDIHQDDNMLCAWEYDAAGGYAIVYLQNVGNETRVAFDVFGTFVRVRQRLQDPHPVCIAGQGSEAYDRA